MTDKVPLTESDLQSQLSEQLEFLESSANRYDTGYYNEAKRMAISLRILLHDSNNSKSKSKSLLGQLGKKDIKFLDTAIEKTSNVKTAYCGLVRILIVDKRTQYIPLLDDAPGRMTGFNSWWKGVIFEDNLGNKMSRKYIVLTMADQDGGAHVDPSIEKDYSILRITEDIIGIVDEYILHYIMPKDTKGDALHLALASYYHCQFLLTWNCQHLANANKFEHIRHVNTILGLYVPILTTPYELMYEEGD